MLNAHEVQICNSFKDNGPLLYGRESPLFQQCRDNLDKAFDNLPPPVPSQRSRGRANLLGGINMQPVDMRRYHRRDNPCFASHCLVTLHNGSQISVQELRSGMNVKTQAGESVIRAVVTTRVLDIQMCVIDNLVVTPWHPLLVQGRWQFPAYLAWEARRYRGEIISVLLGKSDDPQMHNIEVSGRWAVTLGHGVINIKGDVRSHEFFGNYNEVARSLDLLASEPDGSLRSRGIKRSLSTGLACGFI